MSRKNRSKKTKKKEPPEIHSHALTRWAYLRLLGFVIILAFYNASLEITQLIGENGILPLQMFLDALQERFGNESYFIFPTFSWLDSGNTFLKVQCWLGVLSGVLLVFNIFPRTTLIFSTALYLSIATVGRDFYNFQWDSLLIETTFVSIFLAPWGFRPGITDDDKANTISIWLVRWLVFRLMFLSGLVKLLSGDTTWRDFSALEYHHLTQPLPTAIAWWLHKMPSFLHRLSVAVMFFVELIVPFCVFGPRKFRKFAFWAFTFLMIGIGVSGNYTFFNILSIVLFVTLLDDGYVRKFVPQRLRSSERTENGVGKIWLKVVKGAAVIILALSLIQISFLVVSHKGYRDGAGLMMKYVGRFRLVNHYGLFAVMTRSRPEILIQGSDDGIEWKDYQLKYKPGALDRAPPWIAPMHPRLDWQLWFAALGNYQQNYWFMPFMGHISRGNPEVLAFFSVNPFPDEPPKYLRAMRFTYHFTTDYDDPNHWWKREPVDMYAPMISRNVTVDDQRTDTSPQN